MIETAHAEEAILVLQQTELAISVVLSDVRLPGSVDGFGLSRWVRNNRPEVAVMLVGSLSKATEAAAELCEDGPLLSKPYDPQVLLDHIKRLLAQKKQTPRGG